MFGDCAVLPPPPPHSRRRTPHASQQKDQETTHRMRSSGSSTWRSCRSPRLLLRPGKRSVLPACCVLGVRTRCFALPPLLSSYVA